MPDTAIAIAREIAELAGMPIEDVKGYALVFVDQEDRIGVISTNMSITQTAGWLAAAIWETLNRPAPDFVLTDPN